MSDQRHWIFLRGLTRERQHWGDFVEQACERLQWPNYHTIELPGCGDLWQQRSPASINKIREHLQQQLKTKAIKPPYGVVALSLGAMVALDWLCVEPNNISHMVVINSSLANCPPYWRIKPGAIYHVLRAACAGTDRNREAHILKMVSTQHRGDQALIDTWCRIRAEHRVSRSNLLRQLIAASHFRLASVPPGKKGLVLTSMSDAMVSYRCSVKIAALSAWPLHVHASAGHDIALDEPDWVISMIEQWLPDKH